jgi:mannose-6-phosphate isomerase-like protein (cupin superfamily)
MEGYMTDKRAPQLIGPRQGQAYSVVGDRYIFKATGAESDGAYAFFDFFIPPGNGSPPHVHHREDEGFHILAGELTFFIGAERRRVVARVGDFVHAPRDVPHFFRNEGSVPVHALALVAPAGLERFFAEVGVPLNSAEAPPLPAAPEQMKKMLEVAPKYGLEILGPPPWVSEGH